MNNIDFSAIKIDVDEYHRIREEVESYLLEVKNKKIPSSYDNLEEIHKKAVEFYADLVYQQATFKEPSITADLLRLVEPGVSTLVSLNNRLKTIDSLRRKIIANSKVKGGSYESAAKKISDSIRYTFKIKDENLYIIKTEEYLNYLESLGYQVIDFKNTWGESLYQGYNVVIKCIDDQTIFELQFHTPRSYSIKERTRDLYNVVRDQNAPEKLRNGADKIRMLLQKPIMDFSSKFKEYNYVSKFKRR